MMPDVHVTAVLKSCRAGVVSKEVHSLHLIQVCILVQVITYFSMHVSISDAFLFPVLGI